MISLLGRKKGMSAIYDAAGKRTPVTVIELGPCPVVQVKASDKNGYDAVQIAFDPIKPQKTTKPLQGHFRTAGVEPHRLVREVRNFSKQVKPGEVLRADVFKIGDYVDVIGTSKGRGFAGVIKRHGFHRPNQSHGTHENFRGSGSIGAGSYPGRVFPGVKMAGRMGGERVTVKNLRVVKVDAENNILVVSGPVPGAQGGYVTVRFVRSGGKY